MKRNTCYVVLLCLCICQLLTPSAYAAEFKVLVVFSYEESYPTTPEYKKGIEAALSSTCEIRYFNMNTKANLAQGPEKAKEAYELYQEFQPDGLIVTDDNAQSMFVLPYLKDKVKTPVMFCGVNAAPEKYGYPASNVSGVLERLHIGESIALVRQLVPSIKTVGYLMKNSPSARFVQWQVNNESDTYPAKSLPARQPANEKELVEMTDELKKECDLLYVTALQGIVGNDGKPLLEKEIIKIILKHFNKPIITANRFNVEYGALCSIIFRMDEHAEIASNMLLKAMRGTPLSELPVTKNRQGKAIINVETLKKLAIKPDPIVLHGAELIRSEK